MRSRIARIRRWGARTCCCLATCSRSLLARLFSASIRGNRPRRIGLGKATGARPASRGLPREPKKKSRAATRSGAHNRGRPRANGKPLESGRCGRCGDGGSAAEALYQAGAAPHGPGAAIRWRGDGGTIAGQAGSAPAWCTVVANRRPRLVRSCAAAPRFVPSGASAVVVESRVVGWVQGFFIRPTGPNRRRPVPANRSGLIGYR